MIITTPAVILKSFPYGDTSLVARCFTREMGKISIIARGARRKKSPQGAYLQPMSHLEMVYYYKSTRDLQTVSKLSFLSGWSGIMADLKKISYGLAIIELTEKILSEHDANPHLFDELVAVLQALNDRDKRLNLIYWYYQVKLLSVLGFRPDLYNRELPGYLLPDPAAGPNSRLLLEELLECGLNDLPEQAVAAADRKAISEFLSAQFRYHFEGITELHTLKVLKQILD